MRRATRDAPTALLRSGSDNRRNRSGVGAWLALRPKFPARAAVITGASADGYRSTASSTTARLGGRAAPSRAPGTHPPRTDGAREGGRAGRETPAASSLWPSAVDRKISGRLAFLSSRWALALGAWLGSQGAARGRVDALVAIIPADPIARRRVASQHFLNHTRAGSTSDRLRLGYHAFADCKSHSHSRLVSCSRA